MRGTIYSLINPPPENRLPKTLRLPRSENILLPSFTNHVLTKPLTKIIAKYISTKLLTVFLVFRNMDSKSDSDFPIDFASIPKLTNDNYHLWREDVMIQLCALDALEITIGTETAPTEAKAARRFRLRSGKALALIHSTCSPNAKSWVSRVKSPSAMWEALKTRYHLVNSDAGQMAVLIEFSRARPEPADKSILDYIMRLKDCCDRLGDTPSAKATRPWRARSWMGCR